MTRCMTQKRAPLTRDRVLRAALELADEGGTTALTMQRIGRRLGVEAMALHRRLRPYRRLQLRVRAGAASADGRSLRRFSLLHSPAGLGAIARAPEAGSVAPESWRAVVAMSAKCGGVGGFGRLKTHARSQKGRLKGRAAPATDRASPASGSEPRQPCRERAAQNWTSHAQTKLGSSEMCSVLTLPHAPPGGRRQRGARACKAPAEGPHPPARS